MIFKKLTRVHPRSRSRVGETIREHSKAKDPKGLVGKLIAIEARVEEGKVAPLQARFIQSLQVGEKITVDVAHQKGESLTILELTDDQRQRAKE